MEPGNRVASLYNYIDVEHIAVIINQCSVQVYIVGPPLPEQYK